MREAIEQPAMLERISRMLCLASISTGNILITPVAIGNPPGLSPVGSSHCGSLADPVLKELSDAAPAHKGYRQILKHFTIEML